MKIYYLEILVGVQWATQIKFIFRPWFNYLCQTFLASFWFIYPEAAWPSGWILWDTKLMEAFKGFSKINIGGTNQTSICTGDTAADSVRNALHLFIKTIMFLCSLHNSQGCRWTSTAIQCHLMCLWDVSLVATTWIGQLLYGLQF